MTKHDRIRLIREECHRQGVTMPEQIDYILATAEWETAHTYEPVKEAFWLSENWRKKHLRYYPYYGRGLVQITWKENYEKFGKLLGIDLVTNPDLALDFMYANFILVRGFRDGLFTGKKISDYINKHFIDYVGARACINYHDRAKTIASMAHKLNLA
jgi:hypothetical protein